MTFKVFSTIFFPFNLEQKSTELPILKMKSCKIPCEVELPCTKIIIIIIIINIFIIIIIIIIIITIIIHWSQKVYIKNEFPILCKLALLAYCVMVWLVMVTNFMHIWFKFEMFQISLVIKKSLKFNHLSISKFRFLFLKSESLEKFLTIHIWWWYELR